MKTGKYLVILLMLISTLLSSQVLPKEKQDEKKNDGKNTVIKMTVPHLENSLGLVDRLVRIKFYSEWYILAYIKLNKLSKTDSNKTIILTEKAYQNDTIKKYVDLKIEVDRILLQLTSDLSRNKFRFFSSLDKFYARNDDWKSHGCSKKMKHYSSRYKSVDNSFEKLLSINHSLHKGKTPPPPDEVQFIAQAVASGTGSGSSGGGSSGGSVVSDITSIFSTIYGVYQDILTSKINKEWKIIVLLNGMRLSTPEDLLNNTTSQMIQQSNDSGNGGGNGNGGGGTGTGTGGGGTGGKKTK